LAGGLIQTACGEFVESGGLERMRERRHAQRKSELERLEDKARRAQEQAGMDLRLGTASLGRRSTLPNLLLGVVDFVSSVF
jgi:hypothetical protein